MPNCVRRLFLGLCWTLLLFPQGAHAAEKLPNFVFILVDDLGWRDLGCYGSTFYETPRIDRLAEQGMQFSAAYAAAPVCSPTRASIMSGKSTARLGFTGHITAILKYRYPDNGRIIPPQDHMRLRLRETTIAEVLKPAGYVSASIGKWHLGPEKNWPRAQGFDFNIAGGTHGSPPNYFYPYKDAEKSWNSEITTLKGGSPGEYLTDRLTEEAIQFIESNRSKPFFLYLTHYAVHTPLQAPRKLVEKYEAKLKHDQSQKNAVYAAMIEAVDTGVGRVLDTLDRLKLTENTVVIFFSDNGGSSRATNNHPLRGGKQDLYEGGIRVPLIVRWPGHVAASSNCDVPVISDDFLPTMAEAAGLSKSLPAELDGRSLMPLLTSESEMPSRRLFWYYPHYARRPGSVVREGDFKLIEYYDPPQVELYNLAEDLSEAHDLAKTMPDKVSAMRQSLSEWLTSSGTIMHTQNPAFQE